MAARLAVRGLPRTEIDGTLLVVAGRNPGTISCWVKFDDLQLPTATHRIIGGASYHETFLLNQYGDRLFVYWGSEGGPQTTTTTGTFTTDTWYHLAMTNTNGALAVYVDGEVKATASQGPTEYNWNHALFVGGYPSSWTIDGYIDDVAIWNQALDSDSVALLAVGVSPLDVPEPSPLVLTLLGLLGTMRIGLRRHRR